MKSFDEFEDSNQIKKITPNYNEINSIKKDSIDRFKIFWLQKNNKTMSKYVFENLYGSLRELSECIALNEGYKIYSHEITISLLLSKGYLNDIEANVFDSFRKLRNQSKYYGKEISFERLNESLEDFKKLKNKLLTFLKRGK